jgi:cell division protein ZapA
MAEISITIKIANRDYPLKVQESDVEQVKGAAAKVNENIQKLKGDYIVTDYLDLLAMTALQFASASIDKSPTENANDNALQQSLQALAGRIDAALQR